jgi:hypothetical protein
MIPFHPMLRQAEKGASSDLVDPMHATAASQAIQSSATSLLERVMRQEPSSVVALHLEPHFS